MKSYCMRLAASAGFAAVFVVASAASAQQTVPSPVCPAVTLAPATLPNGTVGIDYSQTIEGSGGTAPYTFRVLGKALPLGLSLTSAGVLEGVPITAGTSSILIGGTDVNGCFGSIASTLGIADAVVRAAQRPR